MKCEFCDEQLKRVPSTNLHITRACENPICAKKRQQKIKERRQYISEKAIELQTNKGD